MDTPKQKRGFEISGESENFFHKYMEKIDLEINAEEYKFRVSPFKWFINKIRRKNNEV